MSATSAMVDWQYLPRHEQVFVFVRSNWRQSILGLPDSTMIIRRLVDHCSLELGGMEYRLLSQPLQWLADNQYVHALNLYVADTCDDDMKVLNYRIMVEDPVVAAMFKLKYADLILI